MSDAPRRRRPRDVDGKPVRGPGNSAYIEHSRRLLAEYSERNAEDFEQLLREAFDEDRPYPLVADEFYEKVRVEHPEMLRRWLDVNAKLFIRQCMEQRHKAVTRRLRKERSRILRQSLVDEYLEERRAKR